MKRSFMGFLTVDGKKETNTRFNGADQHLIRGSSGFSNGEVSGLYKDCVDRASDLTGVIVIYDIVMPNHMHQMLSCECCEAMTEFYMRTNTRFAKNAIKITDRTTGKLLFPEKKVFMSGPMITPQMGLEQFLCTISYYYHNGDRLKEIEFGGGEYRKSAAWEYEKGIRTIDNDPLLMMLKMTWPELSKMMNLPLRERMKAIHEFAARQDKKTINRLFKIDPGKPFTSSPGRQAKDAMNSFLKLIEDNKLR